MRGPLTIRLDAALTTTPRRPCTLPPRPPAAAAAAADRGAAPAPRAVADDRHLRGADRHLLRDDDGRTVQLQLHDPVLRVASRPWGRRHRVGDRGGLLQPE